VGGWRSWRRSSNSGSHLIEEICTVTDRQLETLTSQLQQASLRSIAGYPCLPLDRYLGQSYFHRINVNYPGLQLVSEEPYIFLVKDFLTAPECEKLMLKIVTNVQKPSSPNDAGRTSSSVIARNDELRGVREKIGRLTDVAQEQLQPTKMTHYLPGQRFERHTDSTYFNKRLIVNHLLKEQHGGEPFDSARHHHLFLGLPDRFVTVFVYLNSIQQGGRTRWTNLKEDPQLYSETLPAIGAVAGIPPPAVPSQPSSNSARELSIVPQQGMAVVHFPTSTQASRGVRDRNADHESEPAVDPKFILQQFIWSSPLDPTDTTVLPQIREKMTEHLDSQPERPLSTEVL